MKENEAVAVLQFTRFPLAIEGRSPSVFHCSLAASCNLIQIASKYSSGGLDAQLRAGRYRASSSCHLDTNRRYGRF